jgi:predicted nucleotidyltransferase component of viral defense system
MKLHQNKQLFKNIIDLTAAKENIPPEVVEKDYYVVLALKLLYEYDNRIIFIGGTALSKCFNIIKRFSEDIDFCVEKDTRKQGQKLTHKIIGEIKSKWSWSVDDDNEIYKDFKVLFLNYGEKSLNFDYSMLENRIKLELITFIDPFPILNKKIAPYIMKYMTKEEIEKYDINEVNVKTQEPYRTLFEKVMLQKELYYDYLEKQEKEDDQIRRARDFYDIHKIWLYYENKFPFDKTEMFKMLESRNKNKKDKIQFNQNNINEYTLYDIYLQRNIRKQLEDTDRTKLTIRDLNCDEIEISLKEIDAILLTFTEK